MDVRPLVAHHHALWRRFADYFVDSCSWEELTREHETSHQNIANVAMHAVNMEDWYLHSIFAGTEWDGPAYDGFTSAKAMRERVLEVEAKTRRLLDETRGAELTRPRTFRLGDAERTANLQEMLAEVLSEATHHRGEVMAMLWRMDKEPPYVNFLDWRDEKRA